MCSGGCCFSAVITLLSISTERKARGRKVKSRRRKKAWSVEGNNAEEKEKAQISGTSKTARGLRTGNKQAPFPLVVPQLDLGGLLRLSVRLPSLISLGLLGVPWGAAVTERTSSQLLFPAETESA